MHYVATINLDYNAIKQKEYQKLLVALEHAGWNYIGNSALFYDGEDLDDVRRALALLSRSMHLGGNLTTLSLQVQSVDGARSVASSRNRVNAYTDLMRLPEPSWP